MYCIYLFSDEYGLPKYVGKSKNFNQRIKQHLNKDRFIYKSWFYNWLNKQINESIEYFIDVLEICNDNNWQEKEKYWIKHIRENGYKLTNMTDGGDGNNNQIFNKESNEKRVLKLRGQKRTLEQRQNISKSLKGKIISQETRDKLRIINLGRPCLDSTKLKFSKKVIQKSLQGDFVNEFSSLTKASLFLNCRKSSLSNAIKQKSNGKFKEFLWEYKH